MQRASQSSLFRRLILGFAAALTMMALYGLVTRLHEAKSTQRGHTTSENRTRAREIMLMLAPVADRPAQLQATAQAIEDMRRELFRDVAYGARVRMRVWKDGRLVFNSAPDLPEQLPELAGAGRDAGNAWVRWTERHAGAGLVVERSHEVDDEWIFSAAGAKLLLMPFAINLLLLMLAAWMIVATGLRPLRSIAALISQRSDADLSALPASQYAELAPLVNAINGLMARLGARIEREHGVLVDAAHELKTPLAAIQLNAHLVISRALAGNVAGSEVAGNDLRDSVTRATHCVHQLLALERVGSDLTATPLVELNLLDFVQHRVAAAVPLALQRDIEFELHAQGVCTLPVHRESLAAMLDNLIGNAIKYSPAGGCITVRLVQADAGPSLTIADQGPGIDPTLYTRVFERFYRVPGQEQSGSGLGLAIAERAAARNGARLRLGSGPDGSGLSVTVDFSR